MCEPDQRLSLDAIRPYLGVVGVWVRAKGITLGVGNGVVLA